MTEDDKALVEAGRRNAESMIGDFDGEFDTWATWVNRSCDRIEQLTAEVERLREALHEIDIEAANTIPPDGKDAAFAALTRIVQIINPFRLPRKTLGGSHDQ